MQVRLETLPAPFPSPRALLQNKLIVASFLGTRGREQL